MQKSNARQGVRLGRRKNRSRKESPPLDAAKRIIAQIVDVSTGEVFEFTSLAEAFTQSRIMKKNSVPHYVEARDKKDLWCCVDTWVPDADKD